MSTKKRYFSAKQGLLFSLLLFVAMHVNATCKFNEFQKQMGWDFYSHCTFPITPGLNTITANCPLADLFSLEKALCPSERLAQISAVCGGVNNIPDCKIIANNACIANHIQSYYAVIAAYCRYFSYRDKISYQGTTISAVDNTKITALLSSSGASAPPPPKTNQPTIGPVPIHY